MPFYRCPRCRAVVERAAILESISACYFCIPTAPTITYAGNKRGYTSRKPNGKPNTIIAPVTCAPSLLSERTPGGAR